MPRQLTVEYPDNLPDAINQTQEEFEKEAVLAMAVKLFEMGRISSGMAAKIAGLDRVSFLLRLKDFNVPMINLNEKELHSDFQNA